MTRASSDTSKAGPPGRLRGVPARRWRRSWDESRLLSADGGILLVVKGDERLGLVNWRRKQTTTAGYCFEIGVALLPKPRGRGGGTRARRLLARYLFAHTTVHRIWAGTGVDNIAGQRR